MDSQLLGKYIGQTYYHALSENVLYYEHGKIVNGRTLFYSDSTYKIY